MKSTKNKTHQTSIFEPELFQIVFKLEGGEVQTTRQMTSEECQDFFDFLEVFAITPVEIKILKS
jgi:hypothetical protein